MQNTCKAIFILGLSMLSMPTFAHYAWSHNSSAKGGYANVFFGPSFTPDQAVDVKVNGVSSPDEKLNYDVGHNLGFGVGYQFQQMGTGNLRAEASYTQVNNDIDEISGHNARNRSETSANFLMANLYYDFNTQTEWTPYVGAGIGWAHIDYQYQLPGVLALNPRSDDTDSFAYQFMAGLNYRLNNHWEIGGAYHYMRALDKDFDENENGLSGTFAPEDYQSHNLELKLHYWFNTVGNQQAQRSALTYAVSRQPEPAKFPAAHVDEPVAGGKISPTQVSNSGHQVAAYQPDMAPGNYTLQVMGSHKRENILAFMSEHPEVNNATVAHRQLRGQDWYELWVGEYATMQQAKAALHELPPEMLNKHPWIRTIPDGAEYSPGYQAIP